MLRNFKLSFSLFMASLFLLLTSSLLQAEVPVDRDVKTVTPEVRTPEVISPKPGATPEDVVTLTHLSSQHPGRPDILTLPPELIEKLSPDDLKRIISMQLQKPQSVPELMFQESIIVPVVMFLSFAVIGYFIAYYSYRKRSDVIETVKTAITSGQALPDSFIESLENRKKPTQESDLRKAVVLLALGLSVSIILAVLGTGNQKGGAALGVLPTLLGLAYLFLWKVGQKKSGPG